MHDEPWEHEVPSMEEDSKYQKKRDEKMNNDGDNDANKYQPAVGVYPVVSCSNRLSSSSSFI